MKKLNYKINQYFTYGLGLTFAFPFGLACLIAGIAIESWALLGFGLIVMLISIIFAPLSWLKYKKLKHEKEQLINNQQEKTNT